MGRASTRNGIIGMYGQRTTKYDVVRQLNLEIAQLGPHLLRLNSVGVYHWPDAPRDVPPSGVSLLDGSGLVAGIEGGEFVVGEFVDDEGLPWLMVVNRDREHAAWTTLRLRTQLVCARRRQHDTVSEVARSNGQLRPVARDQSVRAEHSYADGLIVQFWLAPADGRLMRLHSTRSQ